MSRAFVLLLDSFGIGASLDAKRFGDIGADTFGHIAERCASGNADVAGIRQGRLHIPNLTRLGLAYAALASTGKRLDGIDYDIEPQGCYGYAVEQSLGKDTPSGHWELAGVPVEFEWGYFPPEYPSFPEKLIQAFCIQGKLPGVLGNCHASGTEIIARLGEQHIKTGKPILYTSADSVFQIAAHEEYFGLQRLYELCDIARKLVDEYNIGRVIARPFIGEVGNFIRTANRKDLSTAPPAPTLLEQLCDQGGTVYAVGKTGDIYAHKGVSEVIKGDGNMALFDATVMLQITAPEKSLVFTNFVDFDSKFGHRRDVAGYAKALEELDARLDNFMQQMRPDDLAIITADHGCDPTWPGSDHTREHIPVLAFGPKIKTEFIGRRDSFADVGQSIASHLKIKPLQFGNSFL